MNDDIENIREIYDIIIRDPELFEKIVREYSKEHPNSSPEEVHINILKIISSEYLHEADEEKIRRQRDIVRDRVVSKVLNSLPDGSDINIKKSQIKEAVLAVSNSSTGHERETLADLLGEYSTNSSLKIKKRKTASSEIQRGRENV